MLSRSRDPDPRFLKHTNRQGRRVLSLDYRKYCSFNTLDLVVHFRV